MCSEDFVNWKDACTQLWVNLTKDEEGNSVKIGLGGIKFWRLKRPRVLSYKNSYGEGEFKNAEIIRKKKRIDVNVKIYMLDFINLCKSLLRLFLFSDDNFK